MDLRLDARAVAGSMSVCLDGQTALVTGAGRGIGRAIALACARAGAAVALVARSEDELEDVTAEIAGGGGNSLSLPADVSADEAAPELVERADAALGPVDVLVNAAGISPVYSRAEAISLAEWDAIMATNLRAAFALCQAVGRTMLERRRGSIVNVASIGAEVALPRLAAYCASKAGLVALTKVLAVEWADRGIRVNAVAPAFVRTKLAAGVLDHPKFGPAIEAETPLGRPGEADEVAAAALYLASDAASYTTGHVLHVDGGWTAR
jgi:NAD(P)-dependent dehydrogenase (short-subunit alcohol dehydrogenase family)